MIGCTLGAQIRTGFDGNTLAPNDDYYTGLVNIGFTANFFGTDYSQLYVNNNGNVTFDAALSTYTPFDLTSTGRVIIAPFFADVDTRGPGDPVTYGTGLVDGYDAFGVNYLNVAHYYEGEPLNSFQLVLIDRSDIGAGDFDIEFNYGSILWESGTASGGDEYGLGGYSARAGYSNGSTESYEIYGSAINGAFLDSNLTTGLINTSNIGIDGRYLFSVRNGEVINPGGGNSVPEPSTYGILGSLVLLGLVFLRRLHKV